MKKFLFDDKLRLAVHSFVQKPSLRFYDANYFTILFYLSLLLTPSVLKAQTFVTPTILSACNKDTICLSLTNQKGVKGVTYSNAQVAIDIPGGALINYVSGSLYSIPAGVAQISYVSNHLVITVPMPAFAATTKVCFAVRPSCDITTVTPLPQMQATITYPAGYPVTTESVTSPPMNVGAVSLTHSLYNLTNYGNPSPAFGAAYPIISFVQNTGYGTQKEVIYKTIVPNTHAFYAMLTYSVDIAGAYVFGGYVTPTITPYDAGHNLHTYIFKGNTLGTDGVFTLGERISPYEYLVATQVCSTFTAKRWAEISCGSGEPLCIKPDTLYSTITQAAGTPKLDGTLVSMEQADGCPNKHGIFKVKNTGVGNAAPVGNAYDVDLGISFNSGLMLLNNIQLNGITVPLANITPNGFAATTTTIKLKNLMTTDPDGAGVGIEDLDGDGFYDDMRVDAETTVSFDYTVPCDLACGAQLDYKLTAYNTFTDYCRTLVGVTSTPLHHFGFEQVQAVEQTEQVDYGTLTTGQSATRTAKFQFQFKQHNMNFTNASGELRIRYNPRMEVNPATILLNGVSPTNAPIVMGDNSTGAPPDNDSMYVVQLTPVELTALFDGTADNLWYAQTYYGCDLRQNNKTADNWQLVVKVNQNLCSDGSSACAFDVSCKKPFAFTSGFACGTKPCYIQTVNTYRESPTGYTAVNEQTPISPIDSARSWVGDTITMNHSFFITGDSPHEPNGFWTAQGKANLDLQTTTAFKYSVPKGWNGKESMRTFLENFSTVSIYQRIPDPTDILKKGTIGAKIFEAPLILGDFAANSISIPATEQNSFTLGEYTYPAITGSPDWYCINDPTAWHISGLCPIQNKYWYDADYNNIFYARYINEAKDKVSDTYYLNVGQALSRAGWHGSTGDDNYYFEVKTKWRMNEDFPWDNTNSFYANGYVVHNGNYADFLADYGSNLACSYNGSCGTFGTTHLTTAKEHLISNPNSVYYSDCALKVNHDLFFETQENNYFQNGEVRVPLKIDSVVIDLPSEYGLTAGTFNWKYNQSCADQNSTAVTASALAGHIRFTNSAGGDFPRADDCSGNKVAYQLCYNIAKTGSAAPTQYRFPIKIYGRDEFGVVKIFKDSATIVEAKPELTLTPLTPILTPSDGGSCEPAYFDFQIQNNTLYDAGHVYLAAESTAGTTMVRIGDGDNVYADPIISTDISTYGASNVFAKIGTIKAGDIRRVRVYANTNTCAGNFNVYVDFGCAYPSPLQPNLASTTLKQTSAQYQAQAPGLTSLPVSDINVATLCDVKTVEIEVRNIRLGNLYKGNVLFDLPAGASMVAGTAQYHFPNAPAYNWTTIPSGDVTQPAADMVNLNLANLNPFNTTCGLAGADEFALSHFRVKFNIEFTACATVSQDYITYTASGENYCGMKSSTQGVVRINYLGNSPAVNNYTLTYSASPINICGGIGASNSIADTIIVKNIGGYGTASGTSTGMDLLEITTIFDATKFQISNITVNAPFTAATTSVDVSGNLVLHTNVPAGIAVNGTQSLILTYTLVSNVAKLCTVSSPALCYSGVIKSSPDLSCPTKALSCSASFTSVAGHEFSPRPFQCCYGSIGDYVFVDTDHSNTQTAGDTPIKDIKVYLLDNLGLKIDSTLTDINGLYKFDSLFSGVYSVQFVAPIGQNFVTSNSGADDKDSDAAADGKTGTYTIDVTKPLGDPDRDITTVDAGIHLCTPPSVSSVAATSATCTNGSANSDATVAVTGITGMAKYAYRTNATDSLYALNSTASTASSINLTGLANPSVSTTYTFRMWGTDTTCYNDTTVILTPSVCCTISINSATPSACYYQNGQSFTTVTLNYSITNAPYAATYSGKIGQDLKSAYAYSASLNPSWTYKVALDKPKDTAYVRLYRAGTGCDVSDSLIFNLPAPCVPQTCAETLGSGEINGIVWNDPNYNGVRDTAETVGIKDVWIKIYACNVSGVSVLIDSVKSDVNGKFSKTGLTNGTKYRLEYTNLPTGTMATFSSTNSPTTVQFLTVPACASLGVAWSSQYCQDNPLLATSCYVGGNQITGLNNTLDVLIAFPYSASGTPMNSTQSPAPTHLARANQMGSTFGLAYQRQTKTLFTASYFKYSTGFAAAGQDAIYKVQAGTDGLWGTGDDVLATFLEFDTYFGANSTGTDIFATNPKGDSLLVGKASFGDIEMATNDSLLYVLNLNDSKIYHIPLSGSLPSAPLTAGDIKISPTLPIAAGCATGILRPGALEVLPDGDVLVGAVCANETGIYPWPTKRLFVFKYHPTTQTYDAQPVLEDYPTGAWGNWNNTDYYRAPLFVGLELVGNDLVIGLRTRESDQTYERNSGDVLKACPNGSGGWTLESDGICGGQGGSGAGEFFLDNGVDLSEGQVIGGMTYLPGKPDVVVAFDDPYRVYSAGFNWFDTDGGTQSKKYEVFAGFALNPEFLSGKQSVLGELEAFCAQAPKQIGNYVWLDANADGIQDPCESPLSNINVSLYKMTPTGANLVATTTTNANGNYVFTDRDEFGGFDTLQTDMMYFVVLGEGGQFSTASGKLTVAGQAYLLTSQNTGGGTYPDLNDSDAFLVADAMKPFNGYPTDTVTVGGTGYVNHSLDFGLKPATACIAPTLTSVAKDTAVCTNGVIAANAWVAVRGIVGMTKYAYRTNATDNLWANTATTSIADSIRLSNLANPSVSTTYTFRMWGTDTTCYNDTTVILTPSVCPPCSITATFTQGMCNNNGTTITGADDYFTVLVSGVSATNGGTSGKYEVVLNGTVLNTGGTDYGTSVTVGTTTTFKSDGATTYQLKVRDMNIAGCESSIFTTTASAACSTIVCPPQICLPVTITRN